MKISLTQSNGRYGFDVRADSGHLLYSSRKHFFITPSVKSSYAYAWEACRDAWNIVLKRPYHLRIARYDMEEAVPTEVSAEDMLIEHYMGLMRNVRLRLKGAETSQDKEEIYQVVKMILTELQTVLEKMTDPKSKTQMQKIIAKYQKLVSQHLSKEKAKDLDKAEEGMLQEKTASTQFFTDENIEQSVKEELVEEYAQKACRAIQNRHNNVYYTIDHPDMKEITILDINNSPMIKLRVNDNLNIDSIIPVGKLQDICPYHSVSFYQKYWKPIVEELNHFCIGDQKILVTVKGSLPDSDKSGTVTLEGWNCADKNYENVDLSFRGERPIWILEPSKTIRTAQKSTSKYIEQDYVNAIVRCIDEKLKSIYGRTGVVIQVIPQEDIVEVDVDFGRGLGIVRLTEKQIDIVHAGA